MCLKFLFLNPLLICPLLKYSCSLVWLTTWHSSLREVLMNSEGKMGEVGMRGTPKNVLPVTLFFFFLLKGKLFTYNFYGWWLTMHFVNLPLSPLSSIFSPVTSSASLLHSFLYLSPDFLLFPLTSCTLCLGPFVLFCCFPLMFKKQQQPPLSTVFWCIWRAVLEMICHKEEEGNKIFCKVYA